MYAQLLSFSWLILATHALCDFYLFIFLFVICFRMHASFLLLVDYISRLKSGNTLLCCLA
jgi:hypothetical protein